MKLISNYTDKELLSLLNSYNGDITLKAFCELLEIDSSQNGRRVLQRKLEKLDKNYKDHFYIKRPLSREEYYKNPKRCKHCGKILPYEQRRNDFCSHSCSASYNNVAYASKSYCLNCGAELPGNRKFCSHDCQNEYNFKKWKEEYEINGNLEITHDKLGGISDTFKKYLLEKNNYSCECCGFNINNPYTGNSILQVHHKDGDC